jgi:hypothetical protein
MTKAEGRDKLAKRDTELAQDDGTQADWIPASVGMTSFPFFALDSFPPFNVELGG